MAPDEATETLVDLANFRGGPDNISIIVAQVDGGVPPTAWPSKTLANHHPPTAGPQRLYGLLPVFSWQYWLIAL